MNTEKLNEISNLIDEGNAFKAHIDGMEAECKSIQKYCLDALQDFHDTFCAVCKLIEKNPQIAHWTDSRSASLGNTGGIGFQYKKATPGCGASIDYIRTNEGFDMQGLWKWAGVPGLLTEKRIEKTKHIVANFKADVKRWLNAKEWADTTREISKVLLEGVRISAKKYANDMKEIMDKGIMASAKSYEKVEIRGILSK